MILTKEDILFYIDEGIIEIKNFKKENLGPVSYDLTISDEVRFIRKSEIQEYTEVKMREPKTFGEIQKLPTWFYGEDVIVFKTEEYIKVPNYITGIVHARSSLTKLPVLFNIAGLVDPGFEGTITGVMYNLSGVCLYLEKMRICQIVFHEHDEVEEHYGIRKSSKNQFQKGVESLTAKTDIEFK